MRFARHIIAVLTIALLAWASVVDNAAVCPDEAGEQGPAGHKHDTPPSSHCCLSAPCHTPSASWAVATLPAPESMTVALFSIPPRDFSGIDSPAPPTPPPTFLD